MAAHERVYSRIEPSIHLTRRQVEILRKLHTGRLPKEIAAEFGISYHTVVEHIARSMVALRVRRRIPLLNVAARHGFLELSVTNAARPADPPSIPFEQSRHRV